MSASIEASLRLEIAQYQQQLARAKAEVTKFRESLNTGGGVAKQVLGADEDWNRARSNIAAARREMNNLRSTPRGMQLGGVSMQMQDVLVQLQSGTRASVVLAQQGSQMASMFGPTGMIIGGLVAAGAMFYDMKQRSNEAYAALVKGNQDFDEGLKKTMAGSMSQMIEGIDKMKTEAAALQQKVMADAKPGYFDPIRRFFSFTDFDANGKGTNRFDAEKAQNAEALAKRRGAIFRMESAVNADKAFTKTQAILEAQSKLDDQKRQAALAEMSTAQRIGALQVDLNRLVEEEKVLKGDFVPDQLKIIETQSRQITLQQQILDLQKQLGREKKAEADAAKRAADEESDRIRRQQREMQQFIQQRNDEKARKDAVAMSIQDEQALLKARSTGRKGDDYQVERDIAIRRRRDQLVNELGMSPEEAMATATNMRDMEERANNGGRAPRSRHTGRKKGMGSAGGGGLDAFHAQQGKAWGVNALPESRFDKLQREGFDWSAGLKGKQEANASAPASNRSMPVTFSQKEIEIFMAIRDSLVAFIKG